MVDTVASLGCMPFEMDAWGIDIAMSGSQKGLMSPPGIGLVAVNARAKQAHKTAGMRTPYWDWSAREGEEHYTKWCGTPPMHTVFGLRKAVDMIFTEGLDNVWRRHALLAEATRRACQRWEEGQVLAMNIVEPAERSNSITNVLTQGMDPKTILDFCRTKCGVVVGQGIGQLSGKAFRIAHMGHTNAPMVIGTLSAIEIALKAMRIPHGEGGVSAAVEYLGGELAA
jgi:alanine-glyoxylate transaminase/serine-glyoxylate transaminase/serine-pyruvate transaminase